MPDLVSGRKSARKIRSRHRRIASGFDWNFSASATQKNASTYRSDGLLCVGTCNVWRVCGCFCCCCYYANGWSGKCKTGVRLVPSKISSKMEEIKYLIERWSDNLVAPSTIEVLAENNNFFILFKSNASLQLKWPENNLMIVNYDFWVMLAWKLPLVRLKSCNLRLKIIYKIDHWSC